HALDLRYHFGEEVGVRPRVDLALEDALRARNGDRGDLAAQLVASPLHGLRDLRLRLFDLALALLLRVALRLAEDLGVARIGVVDDLHGLRARLDDDRLRLLAGRLEVAPALVARGDAVCDLL